jgi:uncharacterized protein YcnI
MKLKKMACALAIGGFTFLTAGQAFGHASFVGPTPDGKRDYVEGTSATLNLNLGHGCGHDPNVPRDPTIAVGMVLPTKASLEGKAYTLDSGADGKVGTADDVKHGGNALMGVKPFVNANWDTIDVGTGTVPEFYNHGSNTSDVVGLYWNGGNVPDNKTENVAFKATLPNIEPGSCVGKIVVQVASVQFCGNGHVNSWIKAKTGEWNTDALITPGYAASFNIVRDLKNNPVPDSCDKNNLETVTVYPDAADIDAYLKPTFEAVARVPANSGEFADRVAQIEQSSAARISQMQQSSVDFTKMCALMGNNRKKATDRCLAKVKKFGLANSSTGTPDSHGCVAPQQWHAAMGHCM